MATIEYSNLINGEWRAADHTQPNINPSDINDVIGYASQSEVSDVAAAVASAQSAARKWSRSGIQQRHDILKTTGDVLLARAPELGAMLAREEGKTRPEGIGEVRRAAQIFHFYAGECLRSGGELVPSVRPGINVAVTREAVGVVGLITPWNFPIAIPAWKIAPALAWGNTVVFKPAELVPASATMLVSILHDAGLPHGVLNMVLGSGAIVGQAMLDSDQIDAYSFTGSLNTGRRVAAAAVESLSRVQLEMGGKNALVILDDCDLTLAVECAVNGAYFSTGQRCTASSRLIVTEGIHDQFVEALAARLDTLNVGHALDEGVDIGPTVSEAQMEQDLAYIRIGVEEGAVLHRGGRPVQARSPGYYVAPALFTQTSNAMRINQEEIFGPVASVIRVRNYEEALAVSNDSAFGLTAGICTSSLKYASDFKREAEAGMVMVNLPTAGVDYHVPFGGRKASNLGPREQGSHARDFYTVVKTAYEQA